METIDQSEPDVSILLAESGSRLKTPTIAQLPFDFPSANSSSFFFLFLLLFLLLLLLLLLFSFISFFFWGYFYTFDQVESNPISLHSVKEC